MVPGQSSVKLYQQNTPVCFVLRKLQMSKDFTVFYCLYHHNCGVWDQKLTCYKKQKVNIVVDKIMNKNKCVVLTVLGG